MKVLWFTNNPCGSVRRHGGNFSRGGWLISLEDEIKRYDDLVLNVCFFSNESSSSFIFEKVHYFPILSEFFRSRISRFLYRFISKRKVFRKDLNRLLNVIKIVQPDIIHIHGTELLYGLIQKEISNIPIVFSIQGLLSPYAEKYYSGLPYHFVISNESILNKIKGCSVRNAYIDFIKRSHLEQIYLKNAKYVIGRTWFDHVIPKLFNSDALLFQGDEILRKEFYNVSWNKTQFSSPIKIVSVLSGGIYKGFETLLHSANLLKCHTNLDFEWRIIGYDDNSDWVKLSESYKGIKSVNANIVFYGRIYAQEMIDILLKSDIFVQVSHIENSPNSLCEAMILGMPIIASFAGGTSSLLQDKKEGILIQDGDPYVLAGSILHMSKNFSEAKLMGENAKNRAKLRHNPQTISKQIVHIYKNIISDFEIRK